MEDRLDTDRREEERERILGAEQVDREIALLDPAKHLRVDTPRVERLTVVFGSAFPAGAPGDVGMGPVVHRLEGSFLEFLESGWDVGSDPCHPVGVHLYEPFATVVFAVVGHARRRGAPGQIATAGGDRKGRDPRAVRPDMEFAPGTWRITAPPLVVAVPAAFLAPYVALALVALAGAVLLFHRDPPRPTGDGVVSPAEGTVSAVRQETDDEGRDRLRIGVYMSARDVHVNRAPLGGRVVNVTHEPGANKPAFSKESDRNERVRVDVERTDGDYELVLVAGWFARRIYPYVGPGDRIDRGERVGHISFGSRADVLCPPEVAREDLIVRVGESIRAGETLAEFD